MSTAGKNLVTIGICVRNAETTVKEALDSIIDQDFPYELIEIIFVDDGSEDGTLSIISDYISRMDIKAKVFHTKWKGVGSARNLVVNNAGGDYIVWVDGDQILTKDYVKKQVEFMQRNPTVGIAAGTLGIRNGENLVLILELIPSVIDHARSDNKRSFLWKTEKLPGTGGSIYRVRAIREVNGFDEHLKRVGEDQDAAKKIQDAGWLISRNDAVFYERHGGMSNLKALWNKYFWYGYGNRILYRKRKDLFSLPRMVPLAGFIAGLLYSLIAYKLIGRKMVFLLPFHFAFKITAWFLGFLKGQMNGHEK